MKELVQQISKNAIALNPVDYTPKEIDEQWIGLSPATDEAIQVCENKLGIKLPEDVLAFYKITNGSSVILNQVFGAFVPIEQIDWSKNADPYLIECYADISEDLTNDLNNSIIIAGINYCHCVLIIQPYGENKKWRYWEFASYIPGETPFQGIQKYLERLNDFLSEQIKNKNETLNSGLEF